MRLAGTVTNLLTVTLVPEVFFEPRQSRKAGRSVARRRRPVAKRRELEENLGLESHFHADANCQTRQTDNYKKKGLLNDNLATAASPRYYQSSEPC